MHRNISILLPDRGIAYPGAMTSWETAQFAHNKVTDFLHSPVFLHSPRLPSFPPCLGPFGASPQPFSFSQATWMTLHSLCFSAKRESYRADVQHLISYRGNIAVRNKYQAITQPLHEHKPDVLLASPMQRAELMLWH